MNMHEKLLRNGQLSSICKGDSYGDSKMLYVEDLQENGKKMSYKQEMKDIKRFKSKGERDWTLRNDFFPLFINLYVMLIFEGLFVFIPKTA